MANVDFRTPVQVIVDASIDINTKHDDNNLKNNQTKSSSESSILTRLHAGFFRISISLASQALLWKILIHPDRNSQHVWLVFRQLPTTTFHLLWWLALLTQISLCLLYLLKCCFHFNMVKQEFLHYIGVNYLYAPWISWLLLLQSSPITILDSESITYLILCFLFTVPIVLLDLKLYGQWFTTEKRFLCTLANPTSQITVIGNLVVARAAAEMGWTESAVCMFSLGMVHYMVLFVTLYQRLSGRSSFPALLRPTFFLFFAAPSMASLAWMSISGAFDTFSKMLFFLSLFLFVTLACRPTLFRKSMRKFNVAWWAYSFTLTFLALASAEYAKAIKGHMASGLTLLISALSVLAFLGLMLLTAFKTERLLRENDPVLSFAK